MSLLWKAFFANTQYWEKDQRPQLGEAAIQTQPFHYETARIREGYWRRNTNHPGMRRGGY